MPKVIFVAGTEYSGTTFFHLILASSLLCLGCEKKDEAAPAEGGYYIVKGCGLPRIDIIGYNRRVAWDTLVKQLEDATRGGQPTVR